MKYFKQIPLVEYPAYDNDQTTQVLTNLLTRSAFLREIMGNSAVFYEYEVKDGETAEVIADKLYGDVDRFWIVLLFNDVQNAFYDFPLTQDRLDELIISKYGITPEVSQTTNHHYELIIHRTVKLNNMVQTENTDTYTISATSSDPDTGYVIPTPSLPGTPNDADITYETTTEAFDNGVTIETTYTHRNVSVYAHEQAENEKKRTIRLLDAKYVNSVENEFKRLMKNG